MDPLVCFQALDPRCLVEVMRFTLPKGLALTLTATALTIALSLSSYFEGFRLHAYPDSGGVYTICNGHTEGVKRGQVATDAECEQYQRDDTEAAQAAVRRLVKVDMPATREAALIDFTYNLGTGTFARSSILRKLNAGDTAEACAAISLYHYVGNQDCLKASSHCSGIVIRREVERWLCEYNQ